MGPSQRGARQQLELYPYADGAEADGEGERRASMALLERLEGRCSNLTIENSNLRGQVQALSQQLSVMRRDLEEAHVAATGGGQVANPHTLGCPPLSSLARLWAQHAVLIDVGDALGLVGCLLAWLLACFSPLLSRSD